MAISFSEVPAAARLPLVYVEIDSTHAAPDAPDAYRTLLIGGALPTGAAALLDPTDGAPAGDVVPIYDAADAQRRFGRGSMLALMAAAYRRQHPLGQIWGVGIDDSAGAAQAQTVTVTGPATAAGTIALYVAGQRVPVAVTATQTETQIAAAIHAQIGLQPDLPVTSSSAAGVVTLTSRHAGLAGVVDVRHSLHPDEALPGGVTVVIAQTTAGATDPSLAHVWTLLGDERYDLVVTPYTGDAQIQSLEAELAARWGATQQLGGLGVAAYRGVTAGGTVSEATTYGGTRNSPYVTIMDASQSLSPDYEWAAAVAGQVARSAEIDPARPFQTLPLVGVVGAPAARRRTWTERNGMLHDGISTHVVDRGRAGAHRAPHHHLPDRGRGDPRHRVPGRVHAAHPRVHPAGFPGVRLAQVPPSQARRRRHAHRPRPGGDHAEHRPGGGDRPLPHLGGAGGWWRGRTHSRGSVICERNAQDRNRLDWLLRPDLVNQFRVAGVQIQFLL